MMRGPYTSSTGHRNSQRTNAVAQIAGDSLATFTPVAIIPTKVAQIMVSTYSIFRKDTYLTEKVTHLLQTGISSAQLGLAITLLFKAAECTTASTDICKAVFLCKLLYDGTLLAGWIPSEFSKDPYPPSSSNNTLNTPNNRSIIQTITNSQHLETNHEVHSETKQLEV